MIPPLGHRGRLRDRFLAGPSTMPDYELLELLLTYAIPRRDTKPLAREILNRFRTLRGFFDAREAELVQLEGYGLAIEAFRKLLREFYARHEEGRHFARPTLLTPEDAATMARKRLAPLEHEELWVAYLDTQNRLLAWEKAAVGNLTNVPVDPRNILSRALTLNAIGIILVHNHPGGSLKPSRYDSDVTERVKAASEVLGVRFVDHLIVTDSAAYSMVGEGLL